jgi:2-C-methyl-D-erythritol 4-phosphate cytidylyltransferase
MNIFTIITAGGTGTRMGTDIPKQFLKLKEQPLLMHTFNRFFEFNPEIKFILSLPEAYISYWKKLCKDFDFTIKHEIVKGGETRFHSVKNALKKVNESGFVAVHDGVRPLVSIDTLKRAFKTAEQYGNSVVSQEIPFSLRIREVTGSRSVDRSLFVEIQTPQIFKTEIIKKAYMSAFSNLFTDDASVVENIGEKIHLCEGNPENIKITTQTDLLIAKLLLNQNLID